MDDKALGRADQLRFIREAVLRFRDTDRQVAAAHVGDALYLLLGILGERYVAGTVHALADGTDLLFDRLVQLISIGEIPVRFLVAQTDDLIGKINAADAAVSPHGREHGIHAQLLTAADDHIDLRVGIGREAVDRDHARELVDVLDVIDMAQ